MWRRQGQGRITHCSGLPDRTTLRQELTWHVSADSADCSGLPDRTTLRRHNPGFNEPMLDLLFRSSGPDYIETSCGRSYRDSWEAYCSGLPDRTTLRLQDPKPRKEYRLARLFRSSGPDYIETSRAALRAVCAPGIVPVFRTGLH